MGQQSSRLEKFSWFLVHFFFYLGSLPDAHLALFLVLILSYPIAVDFLLVSNICHVENHGCYQFFSRMEDVESSPSERVSRSSSKKPTFQGPTDLRCLVRVGTTCRCWSRSRGKNSKKTIGETQYFHHNLLKKGCLGFTTWLLCGWFMTFCSSTKSWFVRAARLDVNEKHLKSINSGGKADWQWWFFTNLRFIKQLHRVAKRFDVGDLFPHDFHILMSLSNISGGWWAWWKLSFVQDQAGWVFQKMRTHTVVQKHSYVILYQIHDDIPNIRLMIPAVHIQKHWYRFSLSNRPTWDVSIYRPGAYHLT